ncbi:MAG: 16S rRNA (cytosine(1402)-N(4))-methyltransferase RsmH [Bacteroidales bacterium]
MSYHNPVLLHESVEGLRVKPDGAYVDLTFGGGGHSREVLSRLGKKGKLLAFDQDPDAAANLPRDKRLAFAPANFKYLKHFLRYHGMGRVDGILADLGISSHQIDVPERGFTFRADAVLDMRMNARSDTTAAGLLNTRSRDDLARIFRSYGELKQAGSLATRIVRAREEKPLERTGDLERVLEPFLPRGQSQKFLAKVYQALRMEVNGEMDALAHMLLQTTECVAPGGRLVILTYHSLEDRMVKLFMRSGNLEGDVEKDFYGNPLSPWVPVNRTVITPSEEELNENKRARSAKLRIAERTE